MVTVRQLRTVLSTPSRRPVSLRSVRRTLGIPLPATVVATYLVLGRVAVDDPDLVVSRSAAGLATARAAALGRHIGDLRLRSLDGITEGPVPPIELLRASGSSAGACDLVTSAAYGWALLLRHRPCDSVDGETATRAAAAVLAAAAAGVVVDTTLPRAYTVSEEATRTAISDLISFDHEPQGTGRRVTTRGLTRFGLPEVTAHGVPSELLPACDALLIGVAGRVVAALQHLGISGATVLELAVPFRLQLDDIASGYGEPVAEDVTASRTIDLVLEVAADSTIVVDGAVGAVRALFGDALPHAGRT